VDLKIGVAGLREASKALRQVDKDAPKGLRLAFNDAANLLVDRTRPKIPSRSGRGRASLKAKSTRTSARVSIGGARARHMPWLDFGGAGPNNRPAARPFYSEGRYVYPTLREIRPEITDVLNEGLLRVVRDAGLDVT
jgi:hypothetical protein